jgi:hypothetical protein
VTYTPTLFTGVGFTCDNIPDESFLDYEIDQGKSVLEYLKWVERLP